LRSFLQAF
jgi:hypothetical protein